MTIPYLHFYFFLLHFFLLPSRTYLTRHGLASLADIHRAGWVEKFQLEKLNSTELINIIIIIIYFFFAAFVDISGKKYYYHKPQ